MITELRSFSLRADVGVGSCLSVETHLSNEFTKTYILTTWMQFSFDAHGYKCVTRNKSLRMYQILLHYYQFFVCVKYMCGLHSLLLDDIMHIDSFNNIPSSRNKSVIYCAETRNIISKFCLSVTCLFLSGLLI